MEVFNYKAEWLHEACNDKRKVGMNLLVLSWFVVSAFQTKQPVPSRTSCFRSRGRRGFRGARRSPPGTGPVPCT